MSVVARHDIVGLEAGYGVEFFEVAGIADRSLEIVKYLCRDEFSAQYKQAFPNARNRFKY